MKSARKILQARIDILQGQIDRAIESGDTENMMGMPMSDQIQIWKQLVNKAERQIAAL